MQDVSPNGDACGWMIKRCVFPTAEGVAQALANEITATFDTSFDTKTALMLAGGTTPKVAYDIAASSGRTIPPHIHLTLTDERHVPVDSDGSNARMIRPMLQAFGCPVAQQLLVDTSLPPEESAHKFGSDLDAFLQAGGEISHCFLGLGADGHTASLFSDDDLHRADGHSAVSVYRPDGRIGISAAPSVIRKSRRIIFVATGSSKREMIHALLNNPLSITAGKVIYLHPHVEIWMDTEADSNTRSS